ncbi:MAG TPA: PBP1A family penicillin-binding protein [Thermoanaerobaculia bacterium]|nr:PBP1A family penicillin-binding protein [Thermoanaerobaculia bacterium]
MTDPEKPVARPDSKPDAGLDAKPPRRLRPRRNRSRLILLFLALVLGIPGGFLFARMIRIPLVESLDTYSPGVITRLYTHDRKILAEYAIQRRIIIPKSEMAPALINAIIATEDASFYKHGGVDPKGMLRAARANLIARSKVEGASTITQQLAKQLFLTPEKSWTRKINEMFLAIEIEKNLTKDQIFEMYANQNYFWHGAYGVEAASRLYFGKHAKDVTIPEAAVLAAIGRRPEYYSPINHPENALRRRNHVLRRMLEEKFISQAEYESAVRTPIVLGNWKEEAPLVGAYFSEQVRQYLEKKFGTEDLYRNGLVVWTTLDLEIQKAAEAALERGLHRFDKRRGFRKPARNLLDEGLEPEEYKDPAWGKPIGDGELVPAVVLAVERKQVQARVAGETISLGPDSYAWTRRKDMTGSLKRGDLIHVRRTTDAKSEKVTWELDQRPQVQGALVVLDVKSGEVRAMVGGYEFDASKFNRAVQSVRQTGSAFKPFVYGAAFEKGLTPADTIIDAPFTMQVGTTPYSPRNYDGTYSGLVTLQRALELSINVPAVKTLNMVGVENVVDFTRRLGVTSQLDPYPSLALGAAGISPLEMTAAYNVFPNQGVYVKPRLIRRISDATDKVLEDHYAELSEATSAQTAYLMSWALQGPVNRGTAYAANSLPGAVAGKTGTTNGFTDSWFVGFTPQYSIGVWVGYDDPSRSLGGGSTGAAVALPIWTDLYRQLVDLKLVGEESKEFPQPPGMVVVPMELTSGRRGMGPCGRVVQQAFIAGTEPDRTCDGEIIGLSKMTAPVQPGVRADELLERGSEPPPETAVPPAPESAPLLPSVPPQPAPGEATTEPG